MTHKEEMQEIKGEKIGEDKYSEHWSLDGHSYVQVPKWVIKKIIKTTGEKILAERPEILSNVYVTDEVKGINSMRNKTIQKYDEVVKKITGV